MPNLCRDVYGAYPVNRLIPVFDDSVGIGEFIFGFAYFCNAILMLFWIYQQKRNSLEGIDGAAMYVIFPVYIPFMAISVLSDILVGLITLFTTRYYESSYNWPVSVMFALVYALQHFVLEGIALTMMQYGCGYQTAARAATYASVWAILTFLDQLFVARQGLNTSAFIADLAWNITLFGFYAVLWLAPEKIMFRRPSVIFYSKFWVFFRLLYILTLTFLIVQDIHEQDDDSNIEDNLGFCILDISSKLVLVVCKPYVIYYTLLADSVWWQGLGQQHKLSIVSDDSIASDLGISNSRSRSTTYYPFSETASSVQQAPMTISTNDPKTSRLRSSPRKSPNGKRSDYQPLRKPLLGMEVGFTEAQELAQEVDNLNTRGDVQLLNFAYISLKKSKKDAQSILGSGSFSKVYAGEYRGIPVAVKMIFTPDLNPEVIRRCCNEAQILSNIRHENVVKIYGVSVLPPSVCIILEKCEYGSLADVLRGSEPGVSIGGCGERKFPLKLSRADRMFLALGCARGVEALHGSSERYCHRDIKSFNFLVNSQLIVKLADLELSVDNNDSCATVESDESSSSKSPGKNDAATFRAPPVLFHTSMMMSSWQAPEVIAGDSYEQSADIYSLAIVLWEIIAASNIIEGASTYSSAVSSPGGSSWSFTSAAAGVLVSAYATNGGGLPGTAAHAAAAAAALQNNWMYLPYGEYNTQREVRARILEGVRPTIPNHGCDCDFSYIELIKRAWQREKHLRPGASEVVDILLQCWQDCVHSCIRETHYLVDMAAVRVDYADQQAARQHLQHEQILQQSSKPKEEFRPGNHRSLSNRVNVFASIGRRLGMGTTLGNIGIGAKNRRVGPPSASLLSALAVMQSEENWLRLEEQAGNAAVVISAMTPHLVLWATKPWSKLTGYLLNEVLGCDLSVFEGMKSDRALLSATIAEASQGRSSHAVCIHYRKDGSEFTNSIHAIPIYLTASAADTVLKSGEIFDAPTSPVQLQRVASLSPVLPSLSVLAPVLSRANTFTGNTSLLGNSSLSDSITSTDTPGTGSISTVTAGSGSTRSTATNDSVYGYISSSATGYRANNAGKLPHLAANGRYVVYVVLLCSRISSNR